MTESDNIVRLTDAQHIRKRTEMYLGSRSPHTQTVINWNKDTNQLVADEVTWTPAIYTAVREVIDNALDEVVGHGHGSRIDVDYDETACTFSIKDDGRGIPIDFDKNEKMHKATMVLVFPRAGRNFGDRGEVRGTNGIGASATINCSSESSVTIYRDGKKFYQNFFEPTDVLPELRYDDPKITKSSSGKTGTQVTFTLSSEVFHSKILPSSFLYARLYEIAANHPNIKFYFNNEKINVKPTLEKTLFNDLKPIKISIQEEKFQSIFMVLPEFSQQGGEFIHSTVNDIPAFNGGTHIDVFKKIFYANILKNLERESKKRGLVPNRTDVSDGILLYNVTTMHAPTFDSQSKTRLINEEVESIVRKYLDDDTLYKKIIKENRDWIESVYARCAERTQKKDDQETQKLARKVLRNKVPKLMDATGKDRSKCILLICEGDSALSQISSVRDPEIHGGLPLRGKILNVRGQNNKTILDNAILQDIMSSIGLTLGRKVDRSSLRYGKVWITCDADTDGANITALLVNFFYLHWPELFKGDDPYFYAFSTPFIIQEDKKKQRHYWYSDDWQQYNPKDWTNCPKPTRAKGLGSLEEIDWQNSLAKPRLIPLIDDNGLAELLDLLFNNGRADDRKEWMSLH